LLRRMGDRRYCVTVKDNSELYAERNWTVGNFCALWAGDRLDGVCNQHLPFDSFGRKIRLSRFRFLSFAVNVISHLGIGRWVWTSSFTPSHASA